MARADRATMGFFSELWAFMRARRRFWLWPILLKMAVFGSLATRTALLFAIVLLTFLTTPAMGADYAWTVVRVIDGDTVRVDANPDLPPELAGLSVRFRGVDTPEKGRNAKCPEERAAGQRATAFTMKAVVGAETLVVRDPEWGKWGGRVIADLVVDGRTLSTMLIEAGHGRPYDGGKRKGWCSD